SYCMSYFSRIASSYDSLRGMAYHDDLVRTVSKYTNAGSTLFDIAGGTGRLSIPICMELGLRLELLDRSEEMLGVARDKVAKEGGRVGGYPVIFHKGDASSSFRTQLQLDHVKLFTCMNAIHHIRLGFVPQLERAMPAGTHLLILARSKQQNDRSYLGSRFKGFGSKENRLYDMDEIISTCEKSGLKLAEANDYSYPKTVPKETLLREVEEKKYSTFDLYTENEFLDSLNDFRELLTSEPDHLEFQSECMILVFKRP
ncbi:MAG: class I SAM-dependent methyltransferase, partial [Nitrososphaerales archaeon]